MIVGIPKEIKTDEYRASLTPAGAHSLTEAGHTVLVEDGAGLGSGIDNEQYESEGARIAGREEVFGEADLIVKVKEPLPEECDLLREGQILYTYLHLAPAPELCQRLLDKKIIGVAYETVQMPDGSLPLLIPMSEVAGRMAVQEGAKYLERETGGRGILLGGVPGVDPGHVVIIGAGVVGLNALKMAVGVGAQVTVLDVDLDRLRYLDDLFGGRATTLMSNRLNIIESIKRADLVIGAVLLAGAKAPTLITRKMLSHMNPGSVLVDVGIDQGGVFETSRPTTHSDPIFEVDGVVHYCVANMPGAVSRTSTFALTNATFKYAFAMAQSGFAGALKAHPELRGGVNVYKGAVTHSAVAEATGKKFQPLDQAMQES